MNTTELNDLELQIDTMIQNIDLLKEDNQALRYQLASSARERSTLQEKNQKAVGKIRDMISQLKEQMP